MITGATKSGFSYRADERAVMDWRFVEMIAEAEDAGVAGLQLTVRMAKAMLGQEGMDALKAHVADPDGFVPADRMEAELAEIIAACRTASQTAKNASSSAPYWEQPRRS